MSFKNTPDPVNISDNEEEPNVKLTCEPCNLTFDKSQAYNLHLMSVAHVQRMLEWESHKGDVKMCQNGKTICDICGFTFSGDKSYQMHLKDAVHQKRLEMIKEAHIRNEMLDDEIKQEKDACQRRVVTQLKNTMNDDDFDDFDPDSNELYCKICDVSCYGMIPFKMHLDGVKHKKKLEKSGIDGTLKCDDLDKSIEELLDDCKEPLIGLEYVVEYENEDPVHEYSYLCELCDTKLITNQMIHHLTGLSHRHKYYKIHDPKAYAILWYLIPRSLKSARARDFAKKTEAKYGRKKIRHLGESPKYDCEPKSHDYDLPPRRERDDLPPRRVRDDYDPPPRRENFDPRRENFDPRRENFDPRRENFDPRRENFDPRRDRDLPRAYLPHAVGRPPIVEQDSKRLDTRLIEKAVDNFSFEKACDVEAASLMTTILVEAMLKYDLKMAEKGSRKDELENRLKQAKKNRSLKDPPRLSDPFLSQVIQEVNKLAKEVVTHDDKILYNRASEILNSMEKKLVGSSGIGRKVGSGGGESTSHVR